MAKYLTDSEIADRGLKYIILYLIVKWVSVDNLIKTGMTCLCFFLLIRNGPTLHESTTMIYFGTYAAVLCLDKWSKTQLSLNLQSNGRSIQIGNTQNGYNCEIES